MKFLFYFKRSFDSANFRKAKICSAQDDCLQIFVFFILLIFSITTNCNAQTSGKYDFYRYLQRYAIEIDPLGAILGRISAQFEERLDPNFSRVYEIVYQSKLGDKTVTGWYQESGESIGVIERIYFTDNSAMLGQYVGLGLGMGLVNKTIALRATAEIGYKIAFGGGSGHFIFEPRILMDSYLITNRDGKRILPYISLPFGYSWW
jgi:hypothetical protein